MVHNLRSLVSLTTLALITLIPAPAPAVEPMMRHGALVVLPERRTPKSVTVTHCARSLDVWRRQSSFASPRNWTTRLVPEERRLSSPPVALAAQRARAIATG